MHCFRYLKNISIHATQRFHPIPNNIVANTKIHKITDTRIYQPFYTSTYCDNKYIPNATRSTKPKTSGNTSQYFVDIRQVSYLKISIFIMFLILMTPQHIIYIGKSHWWKGW